MGFCCTVLHSFSDFPQDSSMPHYQVKSGGAAEICREPGLQAETHTLEDSLKKPGRFFTSSSTGSRTGRGGEQRRNHCWLNACEWFMAQRGRKGDKDVVMHLSDSPLSGRPDCNLRGPQSHIIVSHFTCHKQLKHACRFLCPNDFSYSPFAYKRNAHKSKKKKILI